MNTVNVVWRQACSIKNKSDELVQDSDVPANYSQELSQHSSAIVLQAACADWHEEPVLCSNIASELQELQSTIWEFLKNLDALIDGPFILKERDLTCKFRGSRNQRLLHLKNGKITKVE